MEKLLSSVLCLAFFLNVVLPRLNLVGLVRIFSLLPIKYINFVCKIVCLENHYAA